MQTFRSQYSTADTNVDLRQLETTGRLFLILPCQFLPTVFQSDEAAEKY
jgi:hypothetical protein